MTVCRFVARFRRAALVVALLLPACAALAQSEAPGAGDAASGIVPQVEDGKRIYLPAQFARFAPQTAADIVQQIPGFEVTGVSSERGLGEASQNVLINGQRITGKNTDAFTVLRRIPVAAVRRMEIVDGATLDIGGLSGHVLNVLAEQGSVKGNFAWRPNVRERIPDYWPAGEINVAGESGIGDFSAGLRWDGFSGGGWGGETETHPGTGASFFRATQRHFGSDMPKLSGSFHRKAQSGPEWNINASVDRQHGTRDITTRYQAPGDPATTELSRGDNVKWHTEIGADYAFPLFTGRLKLIGFFSDRHGPNISEQTSLADGATVPTGSRFSQDSTEGERVGRGEYRWKALGADWTVSGEAAWNFVDVSGALDTLDGAGNYQSVPLPGASSRVEEQRGESILGMSTPLATGLSLQLGAGGEYSVLRQNGDSGQTRHFWRPKGSVSLAWNPASQWEMNLKLQRKVWQLNFFDFLASVDLQNNNANGGNPELVPPQSWLLQLETVRNLGARGKLRFNVEAERISDLVDQVPLSATAEAPGNIPRARRLQLSLNSTLLLDSWGIPGGKLDTFLTWRDTSVRDPLTGGHRQFNGNALYGNVEFRHDVPGTAWAWGLFSEHSSKNHNFRLDFEQTSWSSRPFAMVYLEDKNLRGLKVRAEIANFLRGRDRSESVSYVGRRDGPVDYTRDFGLSWGWVYRFQVSGTF